MENLWNLSLDSAKNAILAWQILRKFGNFSRESQNLVRLFLSLLKNSQNLANFWRFK
ncbi:hypothetical protein ACWIUD_00500 [Helicobacter sp. 23-1044]